MSGAAGISAAKRRRSTIVSASDPRASDPRATQYNSTRGAYQNPNQNGAVNANNSISPWTIMVSHETRLNNVDTEIEGIRKINAELINSMNTLNDHHHALDDNMKMLQDNTQNISLGSVINTRESTSSSQDYDFFKSKITQLEEQIKELQELVFKFQNIAIGAYAI